MRLFIAEELAMASTTARLACHGVQCRAVRAWMWIGWQLWEEIVSPATIDKSNHY